MMPDPCREIRPLLGAAALGGLEPAEAIALRAHLDGCEECRGELHELESVARALPLADAAHVVSRREPPRELGDRVTDRVAQVRSAARARRSRRLALTASAVAAAAAVIVTLVLVIPSSAPGGTRVLLTSAAGVSATATLRSHEAGTEVAFHVAGLKDGTYYWLWLTGADGDRIAAGTFRGTPNAVDLSMTAALPLADVRRIWVTDAQDTVVLDKRLAGTT